MNYDLPVLRNPEALETEAVPEKTGRGGHPKELVELGGTTARIASIPDLITLKRLAGRLEDQIDIEALEAIMQSRGSDDG